MAPSIIGLIVALTMAGQGGVDLVGLIPTKDYWDKQKVDLSVDAMVAQLTPTQPKGDVPSLAEKLGDREHKVRVDSVAKLTAMGPAILPDLEKAMANPANEEARLQLRDIIAELKARGGSEPARRLMAIRTLGELKEAKAIAALKPLLESKAPFEADTAREAIASIERGPTTQPDQSPGIAIPGLDKAIREDVWLLPKDCGVVGQVILPPGVRTGTVDEMLADLGPMKDMIGEARGQAVEALIKTLDRVGNIRADGATVGVSDNIGDNAGFVVLIVRGLYNKDAAIKSLTDAAFTGEKFEAEKIEGVDAIRLDDNAVAMFPSNEVAVLVAGPNHEALPLSAVAAAIKVGKGKLAENADIAKLVKAAQGDNHIWAVLKMNANYSKAPLLASLDTVIAQAQCKKDAVEFVVKAHGTKAEDTAKMVDLVNGGLVAGKLEIDKHVNEMPALKNVVDMLNSIKVSSEGADAQMTGRLKGGLMQMKLIMGAPFWLFMARGEAAGAVEAPAVPAPPQQIIKD
ncbi:MAG: hypothetical protein PHU85_05780 [Phycisphaerae bacterium]|nr:hypothetical protein [Phycisphaerae bacterium]